MADPVVGLQIKIAAPDAGKTNKLLTEVELRIASITKELKVAKKEADGDTYGKLRDEQIKLQSEGARLRKEVRDQQRAFRESDFPEDSLISLRKQYRLLVREISKLSETDPEFGTKSREADALSDRINNLSKGMGNYKDNVGRYTESMTEAFDITGAFTSGGIEEGITSLGDAIGGLAGGPYAALIAAAVQVGIAVAGNIKIVKGLNKEVRQLADVTEGAEGIITSRVIAIGNVFDKDYSEVLQRANKISKDFGISFNQSFDVIEKGLLAGADINGKFLDQLEEYPNLFEDIGGSADQFVSVIAQAERAGSFGDKAIDTFKEFGLKVREFTPATEAAFRSLGIAQSKVAQDIEKGGILEVFGSVQDKLGELEDDSPIVGQALADIFGGPGEDLGVDFLRTVDLSEDALDNLIDTTDAYTARQIELLRVQRQYGESQVRLNVALGESSTLFTGLGTKIKTAFFDFLTIASQKTRAFVSQLRALVTLDASKAKTFYEIIAEDAGKAVEAQKAADKAVEEQQRKTESAASSWLDTLNKTRDAAEGEAGSISALESELKTLEDRLTKVASVDEAIKIKFDIAALEGEIDRVNASIGRGFDEASGIINPFEGVDPLQNETLGRNIALNVMQGITFGFEEGKVPFNEAVVQTFDELLNLGERSKELRAEQEATFLAEQKERGREFTKQLIDEQRERQQESLEEQEAFEARRLQIVAGGFQQAGELLGGFLTDQEATFGDFLKAVTIALLDAIQRTVLLYLAQILAKEVAEKSFFGIATAAVLNGIVIGFFEGVKGQIRNLHTGGLVTPGEAMARSTAGLPQFSGQRISGRSNIPTQRGGDNVLATVKTGEVVLNERQQWELKALAGSDVFKRLNIPGFAAGGLVNNARALFNSRSINTGLTTPQLVNPNRFISASSQDFTVVIPDEMLGRQAELIAAYTGKAVEAAVTEAARGQREADALRNSIVK